MKGERVDEGPGRIASALNHRGACVSDSCSGVTYPMKNRDVKLWGGRVFRFGTHRYNNDAYYQRGKEEEG